MCSAGLLPDTGRGRGNANSGERFDPVVPLREMWVTLGEHWLESILILSDITSGPHIISLYDPSGRQAGRQPGLLVS